MSTSRTRVVLADDDVLLRQGLVDLGRSGHAVKVGTGLPNSVLSVVGRAAIVQWA